MVFKNEKQLESFLLQKCQSALLKAQDRVYEITRTFSKKKNGKDIESSAELYEIVEDNKNLVEDIDVEYKDFVRPKRKKLPTCWDDIPRGLQRSCL